MAEVNRFFFFFHLIQDLLWQTFTYNERVLIYFLCYIYRLVRRGYDLLWLKFCQFDALLYSNTRRSRGLCSWNLWVGVSITVREKKRDILFIEFKKNVRATVKPMLIKNLSMFHISISFYIYIKGKTTSYYVRMNEYHTHL
jgi:hypothetical protein